LIDYRLEIVYTNPMAKTEIIILRVTREEKQAIAGFADAEQESLSAYIIRKALEARNLVYTRQERVVYTNPESQIIAIKDKCDPNAWQPEVSPVRKPSQYRNPNGHHIRCACEQCKPPKKA
jgi:uncharacterized protein (DUF1778 family)